MFYSLIIYFSIWLLEDTFKDSRVMMQTRSDLGANAPNMELHPNFIVNKERTEGAC